MGDLKDVAVNRMTGKVCDERELTSSGFLKLHTRTSTES